MAVVALQAELTVMTVIRRVAAAARCRWAVAGQPVATGTRDVRMHALEFETGLLPVVKPPERPTVGRMAARTLPAQLAVVCVIHGVAVVARTWGLRKPVIAVAREAGSQSVHALEWEPGQLVIETRRTTPLHRAVAEGAVVGLLLAVNVVSPVAAAAGRVEFIGKVAVVTLPARQLAVSPGQGPARLPRVIKRARIPALFTVTGGAVVTVAPGVHVYTLVAGNTRGVLGQRTCAAVVAGRALLPGMGAAQRKARLHAMVEARFIPARLAVAGLALRTEDAEVNIPHAVATHAVERLECIALTRVTGATRQLIVRAAQRKPGGAVIKLSPLLPAPRGVAAAAVLPQCVAVGTVLFVTAHAFRGCVTVLVTRRVAAGALDVAVAARQREIGQGMVEGVRVQRLVDEIGAAMFGVAGSAAACGAPWQAAVHTRAIRPVPGHGLVAVQAEVVLRLLVQPAVTGVAIVLVLGMRAGQGAGRQDH